MNQADLITLAKAGFTKDDILEIQQAMQQPMQQPMQPMQPIQQPMQPMQQPVQQPYVPVLPQTVQQYAAPAPVVADPLGEALKNMRQSQVAGMGNDYNLNSVVSSIIGADK